MNRREAISAVTILLGGTLIGADAFLSGCKASDKKIALSVDDISLLDDIGDTIIPTTATSEGAKAAKIGEFMKTMVSDCYTPEQQKVFTDGIEQFKDACKKQYSKDFTALSAEEKTAFLSALDKEAKEFVKTDDYKQKKDAFNKEQDEWVKAEEAKKNFGASHMKKSYPPHYFGMIKQLTTWGYFSSEIGMTKELRYMETPGKWDGAYPYAKGEKAWAM